MDSMHDRNKKKSKIRVTFGRNWELTDENNQQTVVKPLIAKAMKTVNFELFAKDRIEENELNYLLGGIMEGSGDDIIVPPSR